MCVCVCVCAHARACVKIRRFSVSITCYNFSESRSMLEESKILCSINCEPQIENPARRGVVLTPLMQQTLLFHPGTQQARSLFRKHVPMLSNPKMMFFRGCQGWRGGCLPHGWNIWQLNKQARVAQAPPPHSVICTEFACVFIFFTPVFYRQLVLPPNDFICLLLLCESGWKWF